MDLLLTGLGLGLLSALMRRQGAELRKSDIPPARSAGDGQFWGGTFGVGLSAIVFLAGVAKVII